MKRNISVLFSAVILLMFASAAYAWNNHAQLTYLIFSGDPDFSKKITAESLDAFLAKEKTGLAAALRDEEAWLKKNLAYYPPLPEKLSFTGKDTGKALHRAFVKAIRVNPTMPFPLFIQAAPGAPHVRGLIEDAKVSILEVQQPNAPFEKLKPGEKVSALEVIATATDEPDFGMDIKLYENSNSAFGKEYGLGEQPWGNPIYSYSTQAPLHMGFFHESKIIALAAPVTQRSLSEYRFHQYSALSVYAFKTGHEYWGFRFAGWALHYLQDSTVVYHERMLPGISTFNVLKAAVGGDTKRKDEYLNSVSNKHYVYEDYVYFAVKNLLEKKNTSDPLLKALGETSNDKNVPAFFPHYIREVSSAKAESRSNSINDVLTEAFPAKFISDPSYVYGTTEKPIDLFAFLAKFNAAGAVKLNESDAAVLRDMGSYSRTFLSWIKKGDVTTEKKSSHSSLFVILIILAILIILSAVLIRRKKRSSAGKKITVTGSVKKSGAAKKANPALKKRAKGKK